MARNPYYRLSWKIRSRLLECLREEQSVDDIASDPVVSAALQEKGLVKKLYDGVKILGNGNLTKNLTVKAAAFTESAKQKIEAAGGKAEEVK